MDQCNTTHSFLANETFCDWAWDNVECWAPTKANTLVEKQCPEMKGSDPTKKVSKYCNKDGEWEEFANWTNYSVCLTNEIMMLVQQLSNISAEEFRMKMEIVKMIRKLEIIGLTASFVVLCLSFTIYYLFRTLRNERTRIHIHLFFAVIGSVSVKLILCIDQIINGTDLIPSNIGIDGSSSMCVVSYIILEYCKSSTYMWMYIEALHLHNAVAVTATTMSFKKYYLFIGWCVSGIFVLIWVAMMASKPRSHCWWGYNYNPTYWILEGPKLLILMINTIYLIMIIKVVFIKLRSNVSNELDKMRKTTKATLVLMPLLGITNYLCHVEPKLDSSLWYFGSHILAAYFLNSFQGMFIGLLYCILNKEVKETVFNKIIISFNSGTNSPNQQNNPNRIHECNMHSLENGVLP